MGALFARLFNKKKVQPQAQDKDIGNDDNAESNKINNYEEDAHDAANLAISMKQGDETTNYELSISCEGLPKIDTLALTNAMVVVYLQHE